jgi:hypothetical protein
MRFVFLKSCSRTATTAIILQKMMYTETTMTFYFLKQFMHAVQQWTIFVHNHGEAILTRVFAPAVRIFAIFFCMLLWQFNFQYSVVDPDPDPQDPNVFGSPGSGSGSGSVSQRYGSGSFYHQAK